MTLPAIELSALAFWLGAAVLTAAVVAPAAFAVLPTRTLAGNIVGQVLPVIFYSGIVVGALVMGLETADNDGWHWDTPVVFGALVAVACAVAQFVVGSRIEAVRVQIGGSVDALSPDDPLRATFGRLHGVSVGLLGIAMLAAAVALVAVARGLAERR
ncbi:MAG TPA: DUF4149 domain-containing protein [Gemmatimonadaceae bacterium]|nr:DUF4149 domain-containing protein [Gemmatimonadaceae bacterium]